MSPPPWETTGWPLSTLITGDLAEQVARLKRRRGRNISVTGSPTLVRSLLRLGLLDELRLLVYPMIVGAGSRLFRDTSDLVPLKLIDSTTFSTGVVSLAYRPAAK